MVHFIRYAATVASLAIWLSWLLCPDVHGQEKAVQGTASSMHAEPWAFGQSADRDAAIWRKGVNGKSMTRKTSPGTAREEKNFRDEPSHSRPSLGLSVKEEEGTWKVAPSQKAMRPDEDKVRDSRHIVRAFADVEAGDDLRFNIGPELILKDDRRGDQAAKSDQPDSELGLGLNFKYDF